MYKHIFISDAIVLTILATGALCFKSSLVLFIIFIIMIIAQLISIVLDIIDYYKYKKALEEKRKDAEMAEIENKIKYLIQRAIDSEGDF